MFIKISRQMNLEVFINLRILSFSSTFRAFHLSLDMLTSVTVVEVYEFWVI